jgi:hypothetical protein
LLRSAAVRLISAAKRRDYMADTKFEFTVSGVNLSDEQKNRISGEIAQAVTRVLAGNVKELLRTPMWSQVGIHGGRMIQAASAREAIDSIGGGCGPSNV